MKKYPAEIILGILFSVGIVGHQFSPLRELFLTLTPFTLVLTSGIVLFSTGIKSNKKLFYWALVSFIFTFITEAVGVKTGIIFGEYRYGESLGFKIAEVPLIIGINWVLVILGCITLSEKIFKNNVLQIFATAIFATGFDYILEPVAVSLDYWTWNSDGIPLRNYVAWFVIAVFLSVIYNIFRVEMKSGITLYYLIVQTVFFLTLSVVL